MGRKDRALEKARAAIAAGADTNTVLEDLAEQLDAGDHVPTEEEKREALAEISRKLNQIRALKRECEDLADDAQVSFSFEFHGESLTYYGAGALDHWDSSSCYGEDNEGRWMSSSDHC